MNSSRLAASSSTPTPNSRQPDSGGGGSSARADDADSPDSQLRPHSGAEPEERKRRGRRTAISQARLQSFNFQVEDKISIGMDPTALSKEELHQFVGSVLRFVPVEVAARYYGKPLLCGKEAAYSSHDSHDTGTLGDQGYEHHFNAAVLFSDISGFTKLTNNLLSEHGNEGAEILNKIINDYFEDLISIITRHQGDVIKFAGDAVLSIWSSNVAGESIEVLTARAVACAMEQIQKLHNWDTKQGVMLQLHLGLGAGSVQGVDLGNFLRREFVVAGEALKQLSDAEQQASSGQLVVSPEAWAMVGKQCSGTVVPCDGSFGPGFYIITKMHRPPQLPAHWRVVLEDQIKAQLEVPAEALKNFYVYAPGPMRPHLVSGKLNAASQFREVTMMFIRIGGLHYSDFNFLERFQRVVYMILSAVYVYKGSLSRVSIDDKGTCVKITFGLPPLYHNDDPARAVRCGLLIRDQIRPMRLKANIGITTGTVFIGYVGSASRGEYTEYGVMVNMAARFMGQAMNEVLVNSTTHDKALATAQIDFDELPAVAMKGFDEPVKKFRAVAVIDTNYYEPEAMASSDMRASQGGTPSQGEAALSPMVGRRELLATCDAALSRFANGGENFTMVVRGESGTGKTKLVEAIVHTLCPQLDIVPIETAASQTESSDHLYVWRQVFPTLPRLLGHTDATIDTVGRKALRTGAPSNAQNDALRTIRTVYRNWLTQPPRAARRRSSVAAMSTRHSAASYRGFQRSTAGKVRPSAVEAADGAPANLLEMLVGAPAPSDAVPAGSAGAGRRGTVDHVRSEEDRDAFEEQKARFVMHESLLNDVLDCGFPVHDATLELSEEVRGELKMQMLSHILASALDELDEKPVVGRRRALLTIEDAQYMDSASWTLLQLVTEVVPSLSVVLTTAISSSLQPSSGSAVDPVHIAESQASTFSSHQSSTGGLTMPIGDLPTEAKNFLRQARIQEVEVRPLGRQDVHDLLCVRFSVHAVQAEVVDDVYQRTAGNALYALELATNMEQREVLKVSSDMCKLAIPVEELGKIELPNSLQAAMSSQLDRLKAQCAACVKAASVMGPIFPAVVLAALSLDGVATPTERDAMLQVLLDAKLVEKVNTPSLWAQFLDNTSSGEQLSGGVYRFSSPMLREVAYSALPFDVRRNKHLAIAKWIEGTIDKVLEGAPPDTHLRLWLYPMLGDHWLNAPSSSDYSMAAVRYFDLAAKAALEASMNHEAIQFIRKELKLLRERSQPEKTATQRARAQTMLADAYLAVGKIPEAKEVVLDALTVLDFPVESSKEVLRKRYRFELRWLGRASFLMELRKLYPRRVYEREEEALTVTRLYEHLGRVAYLLEEMEMHDFSVLRCLNLSLLLRRKTAVSAWSATWSSTAAAERLRPSTEQLARAYAAACIVERVSQDAGLVSRFAGQSDAMASKLDKPPGLMLYTHMMFGLSAMRCKEPNWKLAEMSLREAAEAANQTYSGRRGEEVMHSLGLVLYMSGKFDETYKMFDQARETCLVRHDVQMLGKLTVGCCVPLLSFSRHEEALALLEDMLEGMPEYMKATTIGSNASGLAALAYLRCGDEDKARHLAIESLEMVKHASSTPLAAFWGYASSIEVLLRLLAKSTSIFDLDAAKSAVSAIKPYERRVSHMPQQPGGTAAEVGGSGASTRKRQQLGLGEAKGGSEAERSTTASRGTQNSRISFMPRSTTSDRSTSASIDRSTAQQRVSNPNAVDRWKRASKKVATASRDEGGGGADATRRRRSLAGMLTGSSAAAQKLAFNVVVPDADQVLFATLVEALDNFERFALQHVAATPRVLVYQGMMRWWLLQKKDEAISLLKEAAHKARKWHMPYDECLAIRELAKISQDRLHLEKVRVELDNLSAYVEASEARDEANKLPGVDANRKVRKLSTGGLGVGFVGRALQSMVRGGEASTAAAAGSPEKQRRFSAPTTGTAAVPLKGEGSDARKLSMVGRAASATNISSPVDSRALTSSGLALALPAASDPSTPTPPGVPANAEESGQNWLSRLLSPTAPALPSEPPRPPSPDEPLGA